VANALPGHGDTSTDSISAPVVEHPPDRSIALSSCRFETPSEPMLLMMTAHVGTRLTSARAVAEGRAWSCGTSWL
jgi:hypothetical protein